MPTEALGMDVSGFNRTSAALKHSHKFMAWKVKRQPATRAMDCNASGHWPWSKFIALKRAEANSCDDFVEVVCRPRSILDADVAMAQRKCLTGVQVSPAWPESRWEDRAGEFCIAVWKMTVISLHGALYNLLWCQTTTAIFLMLRVTSWLFEIDLLQAFSELLVIKKACTLFNSMLSLLCWPTEMLWVAPTLIFRICFLFYCWNCWCYWFYFYTLPFKLLILDELICHAHAALTSAIFGGQKVIFQRFRM